MDTRRWQHFTAMALIGDGMMAIVRPHRGRTDMEMSGRNPGEA